MKDVLIYIHGKGGLTVEAEHYKPLFPEEEVIGFDYRASTPWEAREEFRSFFMNGGSRRFHYAISE